MRIGYPCMNRSIVGNGVEWVGMANVSIHTFSSDGTEALAEIAACIELLHAVNWHSEIVPVHVFRADTVGLVTDRVDLGYVLLARAGGGHAATIVGFARVTATLDPQVHWLHELVVAPREHAKGIGFALMQAVRRRSLERGAARLAFTYDPFSGRNGQLYLSKCGARGVSVLANLYGSGGSLAQAGAQTHRFLTEWELAEGRGRKTWRDTDVAALPVLTAPSQIAASDAWRVEIPWDHAALEAPSLGAWQRRVFPLLETALNHHRFAATAMSAWRAAKRNFLVLERDPA